MHVPVNLPIFTFRRRAKVRRFFSKERLTEIEESYKDCLSWEEIDHVASREGLSLTQATFRKYLERGLIPKDVKYNSTDKGRVAIYDSTIISHINLVLFLFSVPSNNFLHSVIDLLNQEGISAMEAVESKLERELYPAIFVDLYQSNDQIPGVMSEALVKHPEVEEKAQKLFSEIKELFEKQLEPKVVELIQYLEKHPMLLCDLPRDQHS